MGLHVVGRYHKFVSRKVSSFQSLCIDRIINNSKDISGCDYLQNSSNEQVPRTRTSHERFTPPNFNDFLRFKPADSSASIF